MSKKASFSLIREQVTASIIQPLCQEIVSRMPPDPYRSPFEQQELLELQMCHGFDRYYEDLVKAVDILKKHHVWPKHIPACRIKKQMNDSEAFKKYLEAGHSFKELFKFQDEDLIKFYDLASKYYLEQHYEEAKGIFMFLSQIFPAISSYWIGLALCHEILHEDEAAAVAYCMAGELSDHDMSPFFCSARCLLRRNRKEEARRLLGQVLDRCQNEESLASFKTQAEMALREVA